MATQASLDLAQQLYVAYYGRPADPTGLTFWADAFDTAGDNLTDALASFGNSAEYTALSTGQTNTQLVETLYQQLFSRAGDADGIAFYANLLETGASTLASIAKQIADGAQGTDVTALANKVTVANTYTETVSSTGATYGSGDIPAAQAILAAVDDSSASVTAGNIAAGPVTYTVSGSANQANEGESVTFTVTASKAVDANTVFTFGVSGDTIDGVADAATSSDYTPASGTVTILAGQSSISFDVNITADVTVENLEGMKVTVLDSTLASIGEARALLQDGEGVGATFTTSTGIDSLTGTAQDDTFFALQTGAADETFGVADTINGGAGDDTLELTNSEGAGVNGATVTSVENVNYRSTAAGGHLALDNMSGVTTLTLDRTVGANDLINVATTTGLVFENSSATMDTAALYAGVAGLTDAANVTLNGVAAGADLQLLGPVETINLTTTGAASTLADLVLDAGTSALNITADANFTIATTFTNGAASLGISGAGNVSLPALNAATIAVNAGTATGNLVLTAGAVAEAVNPGTVDIADITIATGSGNDQLNLASVATAREISADTGAGNDVITIGSALVAATATLAGDVIDGGNGDDILAGTSAVLDDQTTAATNVSSIEALQVTNALVAAITPANFQAGLNVVNLAAGASAGTINFGAGSNTVNIAASLAGGLTLNDTGTATTDSVTINNTAAVADDMGDGQALTVGGLETVNIVTTNSTGATSQDFGAIAITADTGGTATLNLSGTNAVSTGVITAQVVNAANSGALTMGAAMVGSTTANNTITGSAGNDILVGDANDTTNIDGGTGNDGITGGSDAEIIGGGTGNDIINGGGGADTITGGAGTDTITMGGGTESVDAGDDNDTVIAAGNLTAGTTIVGGAGSADILSTSAAVSALNGAVVSGFETLTLSNAGVTDLDNFANNSFTTVNLFAGGAQSVQSVSGQNIVLGAALTADATITLQTATGTSDSQNFTISSAAAVDTTNDILIAGVETINLVMTDTNTTAHQNTLDLGADSATAINISGNAGVVFATGGNTDIADVVTMNASNVVLGAVTDAGVTYVATYNLLGGETTLTGSNGVDSLTGGTLTHDAINGGAGVDTLVYTGGTDVLTGGAGNDVFDINADGTVASGVTIADLTAGDTIDFAGITAGTTINLNAAAVNSAEVVLGSAATYTQYLDTAAAGAGNVNALFKWFQFGGDSYAVIDNSAGAAFVSGTDAVVKLSGVIDLSTSSMTAEVLTFA